MKEVTEGYFKTLIKIKVGDTVFNNLWPNQRFVVESIEYDEDEKEYYIDGFSINHFTKVYL